MFPSRRGGDEGCDHGIRALVFRCSRRVLFRRGITTNPARASDSEGEKMSDRVLSPPISEQVEAKDNMALIARLLPLDIAVFLVYLTIGAPLPVIPLFVHDRLGFDPLIVGIVIGAQAAATLLARPLAGGLADRRGTRAAVIVGGLISALAGVFYFV